MARFFGNKCIVEGKATQNLQWVINVYVLLAKLCFMQKNKIDAKLQIKSAQDLAEEMKDKTLQLYLEKCQEVIDNIAFDEELGEKMLKKREKKIMEMMIDYHLKEEFDNLFRAMSSVPQRRRMSIMPGIRVNETEADKRKFTRLSVFPGTKKHSRADFDFTIE